MAEVWQHQPIEGHSKMIDDSNELANDERASYTCSDCEYLLEALLDMEQQCREAEDQRFRELEASVEENCEIRIQEEDQFEVRMKKLERRRDFALEVLTKHQMLEH